MYALNVSLGQMRNLMRQSDHPGDSDPDPVVENAECSDFQQALTKSCLTVNSKIHACIDRLVQQDINEPLNIEEIDIDEFLNGLDPDIWKAVSLLTQPLSARAIKSTSHVRKIRRFFCVCMLLFTTNPQCTVPIHTFVTDVVETCGGNTRLVRFLNRLGVCASMDTHARYVQYRTTKSLKHGVMSDYPQDAFTVVSVDNLDFIHGHARVYCGKQQLSWHGTTVQIVQPQPTHLTDLSTVVIATGTTAEDTANSATLLQEPGNLAIETNEASLSKRLYSTRSPLINSHGTSRTRQSPVPKRQRRMRTGTECPRTSVFDHTSSSTLTLTTQLDSTVSNTQSISIIDFKFKSDETKGMQELSEISLQYMLQRVANSQSNKVLIDFQTYFCLYNNLPPPECSNIIYFQVLDQKCDNKDTLMNVINRVHTDFIMPKKKKCLLIEGDQDTYNRLQLIKKEYGNDLSWMIPVPGDWHFLKNYQEVLLKIYLDAGLNDLAKASGYQSNAVTSNFKRTHHFLVETWIAMFQHFVALFLKQNTSPEFLEYVYKWLDSFPTSEDQDATVRNLKQLLDDVCERYDTFYGDFMKFVEEQCSKNLTWKFWSQYVFHDCLAYITLHLAIRTGKWSLRTAAIKSMAAVFTAFDRPNYQKLIAEHMHDLLTMPEDVLGHLRNGGYTISILGRAGHSVGIDEAHEMCINKDCKEFITKPSGDYINRVATFLPVRSKAMKQFEAQIFPEQNQKKNHTLSFYLFIKVELQEIS